MDDVGNRELRFDRGLEHMFKNSAKSRLAPQVVERVNENYINFNKRQQRINISRTKRCEGGDIGIDQFLIDFAIRHILCVCRQS